MPENMFSVITSRINISWRAWVFWPTKGTGGLQHHNFLIFDGKQHPKKYLVPWMLKSPLTSVLKDKGIFTDHLIYLFSPRKLN